MKYIPKGVKYIPQMVHTIGMFCKHTKMVCYTYHCMVCTDIDICNKCLYTLYNYHAAPCVYADDQPVLLNLKFMMNHGSI